MMNERSQRTVIESLQLIAGGFGIVHAVQHRSDTGVILAPEVIGDCRIRKVSVGNMFDLEGANQLKKRGRHIQDRETVGPSAVVPGILNSGKLARTTSCEAGAPG